MSENIETWYRVFGTTIESIEVQSYTEKYVLLEGHTKRVLRISNADCYFPTMREAKQHRLQWLKSRHIATEMAIEDYKEQIQHCEARLRAIKENIEKYEKEKE